MDGYERLQQLDRKLNKNGSSPILMGVFSTV
jgi:hypothetical protein